jgi:hypothetical protein
MGILLKMQPTAENLFHLTHPELMRGGHQQAVILGTNLPAYALVVVKSQTVMAAAAATRRCPSLVYRI